MKRPAPALPLDQSLRETLKAFRRLLFNLPALLLESAVNNGACGALNRLSTHLTVVTLHTQSRTEMRPKRRCWKGGSLGHLEEPVYTSLSASHLAFLLLFLTFLLLLVNGLRSDWHLTCPVFASVSASLHSKLPFIILTMRNLSTRLKKLLIKNLNNF